MHSARTYVRCTKNICKRMTKVITREWTMMQMHTYYIFRCMPYVTIYKLLNYFALENNIHRMNNVVTFLALCIVLLQSWKDLFIRLHASIQLQELINKLKIKTQTYYCINSPKDHAHISICTNDKKTLFPFNSYSEYYVLYYCKYHHSK